MAENKMAATKGMLRPHQPGEEDFKAILPEDVDWKGAFRDAIDNAVELWRRIDARFPAPSKPR